MALSHMIETGQHHSKNGGLNKALKKRLWRRVDKALSLKRDHLSMQPATVRKQMDRELQLLTVILRHLVAPLPRSV